MQRTVLEEEDGGGGLVAGVGGTLPMTGSCGSGSSVVRGGGST